MYASFCNQLVLICTNSFREDIRNVNNRHGHRYISITKCRELPILNKGLLALPIGYFNFEKYNSAGSIPL